MPEDPAAANLVTETAVEPAGRFRIYLGAVAGVGKTSAMLDEGWRRRQRGTDVVIGFVETHGRAHPASLIRDLEVVPRKVVIHRGARFEEMDLDAVLNRQPAVALVDELAHTNVPGSGNEKRWQDVLVLLDHGIDVITNVNIQHLESLADAVEQMTGAPVRERVPDWVVRRADQLELIDSSPAQLRRRMLHGNIYPPDKVPDALAHFFRTENLIALRELALRFVADETEDELLEFLRSHGRSEVWETTERIMAGVAGAPGGDYVVRRAARMAARAKADLFVVHVVTGSGPGSGRAVEELRRLTSAVGGSWHQVEGEDVASALLAFARDHQVTQIVVGASHRSRWEELVRGSVVQALFRATSRAGIDLHVISPRTGTSLSGSPEGPDGARLLGVD